MTSQVLLRIGFLLSVFGGSAVIGNRFLPVPATDTHPRATSATEREELASAADLSPIAQDAASGDIAKEAAQRFAADPSVQTSGETGLDVPMAFDAEKHPPLPDETTSLAAVLPEMSVRAAGGDHSAACWLGLELLRCRDLQASRREREFQGGVMFFNERGAVEADEVERLTRIEREQMLDRRCIAVPPAQSERGAAWLMQAAEAGSVAAMERALSIGLGTRNLYPNADQVRWTFAHRERFLSTLLSAGSTVAVDEAMAEAGVSRTLYQTTGGIRASRPMAHAVLVQYLRERFALMVAASGAEDQRRWLTSLEQLKVAEIPDAMVAEARAQARRHQQATEQRRAEADSMFSRSCREFIMSTQPSQDFFAGFR